MPLDIKVHSLRKFQVSLEIVITELEFIFVFQAFHLTCWHFNCSNVIDLWKLPVLPTVFFFYKVQLVKYLSYQAQTLQSMPR